MKIWPRDEAINGLEHLTEYLQGAFLKEQHELHKVRSTGDAILRTLYKFRSGSKWPYEVSKDAPWAPSDSQSTAAMILFAMGVSVGVVKSSVLQPSIARRNQDEMPSDLRTLHQEVQRDFKSNLLQFRKDVQSSSKGGSVCFSDTYGADDPFTLLWLLELLRPYKDDPDLSSWHHQVVTEAKKRVEKVFKEPGCAGAAFSARDAVEHLFPTVRVIQLDRLLRADNTYQPPDHSALREYVVNRLHLHLSYFLIPDSSYDAAELAFALEASLLLDPNSLDSATVDRCREVLFESQNKNHYWRPLRPFIATQKGMVLLPLSVEIANSLLRSFEMLEIHDRTRDHISRNISLFSTYTEWLFTRKVEGTAAGAAFVGWHSEHADDPRKIHLWETSQVQLYLLHYESFLRKHRANTSLKLMNLKTKLPLQDERAPITRWSEGRRSMLSREPLAGLASSAEYAVMHQIGASYIEPRSNDGRTEHYSMLLYGPQGTGKTDLAENIAQCLGWVLITISPSDFTVGGGALVEARAQAIFDVLLAQTDVVILLDEIDRLILDRDSGAYSEQEDIFQFMTPGMLTKFRDLRKAQRTVFIVSTNYADHIDPAIKRAGRIDDQYLILPPDRKQRARIILAELQSADTAIIPSEEELDDITSATVLFIPGELQKLTRKSVDSLKSGSSKVDLLNRLKAEASNVEPTIRLGAYRRRFRPDSGDFEWNQEPYAELLMLFYLLFESGRRLSVDEQRMWDRCTTTLKTRGGLKDEIAACVKDDFIVEKLYTVALGGDSGATN